MAQASIHRPRLHSMVHRSYLSLLTSTNFHTFDRPPNYEPHRQNVGKRKKQGNFPPQEAHEEEEECRAYYQRAATD